MCVRSCNFRQAEKKLTSIGRRRLLVTVVCTRESTIVANFSRVSREIALRNRALLVQYLGYLGSSTLLCFASLILISRSTFDEKRINIRDGNGRTVRIGARIVFGNRARIDLSKCI